jgi:hypothetical protein
MKDLCAATRNGKHEGEYFETSNGEVWDKCVRCGNLFFVRFHDVGSGG